MHSAPSSPGKLTSLFFTLLLVCILSGIAQAEENKFPTDLQEWVPWVLYEQEEKTCTLETKEGSARYCTWPSSLELNVKADGADFSQEWLIETRSLVPLPGNSPFWPTRVQANSKNILVSSQNGQPAVWLDPGKHRVTGKFSWKTLPENILVPPETGLVHLTLLGKKVKNLQLDARGRLWFKHKRKKEKTDEESLNVQVFRKIEDNVPLFQHLRILLTVSGSPRQITLGLVGGNEFIPLQVQSPLPIRLDNKGRLQLQARPGQWQIQLTLRNSAPRSPDKLTIGTIDGPWPAEEIWVFAANPKLRQVEIENLTAVDPSRTSLPQQWKTLPAYLVKAGDTMSVVEKSRGNPNPVPNRLNLHRKIWLDEQGSGFTVLDAITGTMTRGWRLNIDASHTLGKVDVKGTPRLITRLKGTDKIGVEVRQGSLTLAAESRIETPVKNGKITIPALGWEHNFQKLSAELHLPPGWKLFTASGVDKISTWLNRWTLLDIFLVLIIGLATARILGWSWGIIAILTLIISFHQPGSPRYLWLPLLGFLGIQKIISAQKGERICRIAGLAIIIAIVVGSVPYMISEIRTGIYPQLEYGRYHGFAPDYSTMEQAQDSDDIRVMKKMLAEEQSAAVSTFSRSAGKSSYYQKQPTPLRSKPKLLQIDPQDMIQTGPGLPAWEWRQIYMSWNGPVNPEQNISFVFLSPRINIVLAFARVLLLALLIAGFLRRCLKPNKRKMNLPPAKPLALFLFFLISAGLCPPNVNAEVPSPEILQELQDRLLAPPKCGEHCATINSCLIRIDNDLLEVELQVDSQIKAAVPLPGKNRFFEQIILDSRPAEILRLDDTGNSLIRVDKGSHTIRLKKDLSDRTSNKLSFSFPLLPKHGQALLSNWSLNGLHEDGRLDRQISLNRISPAAEVKKESDDDGSTIHIPAFVRVERTLHMGLKWSVTTQIIRRSPGTVIALDIPLLAGEHVTTESLQISNKHVRINMGPEQNILQYASSMDPVDELNFTARKTSSWTETWFLDVSPIWHVETTGLPEINQTNPAGKRYPEYHPYPGESLQLHISRPKGVDGAVMTITKSQLLVLPGLRATETTLSFALTASRGLQHSITLPPGIDLQKTLIDGKQFPLQLDGTKLIIPVRPGKQNIEIGWRSERGVEKKLITESIDLGMESVNTNIKIKMPYSRWILLTGGPRMGPAVLFWGELLVFILFAILLGRIRLTPLSTLQWLLLSLGLSQIPSYLAAVVVAWLIFLGLRKTRGHEVSKVATFNIMQVFLVLLTFTALGSLFFAIQQGLLGHPDMQIGGNGSMGHTLYWYQDRTAPLLPTAWVISVPILAYRISMLLWALWLAMALLRWLRWGWDCFSEGTTWKKAPPRKKAGAIKRNKIRATEKSVAKKKAAPVPSTPKKVPGKKA